MNGFKKLWALKRITAAYIIHLIRLCLDKLLCPVIVCPTSLFGPLTCMNKINDSTFETSRAVDIYEIVYCAAHPPTAGQEISNKSSQRRDLYLRFAHAKRCPRRLSLLFAPQL